MSGSTQRRSFDDQPQASQLSDAPDKTIAEETVVLFVIHRAVIDGDLARAAFADLGWLGRPVDTPPGGGQRRIATDLELPVRDGSGPAVRKAALIDVGVVHETGDGVGVLIAWRSASLAPLFPVFAGHLEIKRSGLTLEGRYAPPFGKFGLLIDRSLLYAIADRTAEAFLERVARQCRGSATG